MQIISWNNMSLMIVWSTWVRRISKFFNFQNQNLNFFHVIFCNMTDFLVFRDGFPGIRQRWGDDFCRIMLQTIVTTTSMNVLGRLGIPGGNYILLLILNIFSYTNSIIICGYILTKNIIRIARISTKKYPGYWLIYWL